MEDQKLRVGIVILFLILISPTIAGVAFSQGVQTEDGLRASATNVTFISTQGGSAQIYEHAGKLVAVHTPTKRTIWKHDKYRRYMDVDPLDENRLLFVAGERRANGSFKRVAVVINWRTEEELLTFEVPRDTHDVDALGNGKFAVADIFGNRAYVYNVSSDTITWEYQFEERFPDSAGGDTDWTHLNDIDSINNSSQFLLSPRNFDRVILINRTTKRIEWTLGEEDVYSILHEQHNPVLLDQSPVTVLVADSENNRIVEYRRRGTSWEKIWAYQGGLEWPRDADRLPNGNTLIVDTGGNRVLEVTPQGRVVWEYDIDRGPYDIERLQHGDEPNGPTMAEIDPEQLPSQNSHSGIVRDFLAVIDLLYIRVGLWLLPPGTGQFEFVTALGGLGVLTTWIGTEIAIRIPTDKFETMTCIIPSEYVALVSATVGAGMVFSGVAVGSLAITHATSQYGPLGLALLTLGLAITPLQELRKRFGNTINRIYIVLVVLVTIACFLGGVGLISVALLREAENPLLLYGFAMLLFASSIIALGNRSRIK